MSKRIVLTTIGSYGDIHPYMALAMELQSRGQDVVVATTELYREKIVGAGLRFIPTRPDIPPPQEQDPSLIERVMHPRRGSRVLLDELLLPPLRESYSDLLKAVEGADLLVSHPITFAGPLVAQKTGIKWISSVLAPVSFMSPNDPPVPPFWPWMNHLSLLGPRFMGWFYEQAKKHYDAGPITRMRDELALPDCGHPLFEGQHSPTLILALFSPLFGPPQPDWPRQTRATGFAFYDGHHADQMPPELLHFLDRGPAPIVFTLGTSAVWVAQDFYRESIAAARSLGTRAVLLIGDERNRLPVELPPEIIAVSYAPYQSLLPRACAMVHHGGVGTTAQGLRAGIPTLIVPFAFDQPDNAAHAARLGGSRTLPRKKYRGGRIARELELLLTEPQYAVRAAAVGVEIRAENGAARASDLIEAVLHDEQTESRKEELVHAAGD